MKGYPFWAREGKVVAVGVLSVFAGLVFSGCGPLLNAEVPEVNDVSDVSIGFSPETTTEAFKVDSPLTVSVDEGRIIDVVMDDGSGGLVGGVLSGDMKSWSLPEGSVLPFGEEYLVSVKAVDVFGREASRVEKVSTVSPQATVAPGSRYVTDGGVYGAGIPIVVNFKTPVANKLAVEEKLKVSTTTPVVGAWSWSEGDTVATFRPQTYWPANTKVSFEGDLYGTELSPGVYARDGLTLDFTIGDSTVMVVDPATLTMTVSVNGSPVKTIPVTIGKAGFETHEGVKVVSAKEGTITMRSAPGSSEPYVVDNVQYSMRLTDHGEYLHAAPWSASAFGNYADSHGCISMTTANAAALWDLTKVGDVVTVAGTGYPAQPDNGISVWNEPWEVWLSKSAKGAVTTSAMS